MLSTLNRSPGHLKTTLGLSLLYWLDIVLLSLPGAAARTPDLLVPVMMLFGLPILVLAAAFTLRNIPARTPTRI